MIKSHVLPCNWLVLFTIWDEKSFLIRALLVVGVFYETFLCDKLDGAFRFAVTLQTRQFKETPILSKDLIQEEWDLEKICTFRVEFLMIPFTLLCSWYFRLILNVIYQKISSKIQPKVGFWSWCLLDFTTFDVLIFMKKISQIQRILAEAVVSPNSE